ncbi:alginate lyase family protein [Streptomyces sp. NPDC050560]|uniref:alginate lyase family protein n=1 Tax=Streptomyces sp. NPDC050560 TaxID=3365630 RepID=UPI0037BA5C5A
MTDTHARPRPAGRRGRRAALCGTAAAAALVAGLLAGPAASAAPGTFVHPGVTVSAAQLDFVREKVNAGEQPWKDAYDQMTGSGYADLDRTPRPREVVECGPYSDPNLGCTDEREDAIAAYTDALVWYLTGDERYARKSIELMDAWSATLRDHTNSNAPLQTGWAGSSWPKAAEIIKYAYTADGGTWANEGRFADLLRDVYLPKVIAGSDSNGNWELTMTEAAVGISVFLEDKASYDRAMDTFRVRVPAYVYLASDGDLPKTVPGSGRDSRDEIIAYWQGLDHFENGVTQETCRDLTHTGYGISSISHIAETSRIQGDDLYGTDVGERLRYALGFQSKYALGAQPPSWLCGGAVKDDLGPITEVGFNALHTRLGNAMDNTQTLTEQKRPQGTNNLFVAWETLTHAENPN